MLSKNNTETSNIILSHFWAVFNWLHRRFIFICWFHSSICCKIYTPMFIHATENAKHQNYCSIQNAQIPSKPFYIEREKKMVETTRLHAMNILLQLLLLLFLGLNRKSVQNAILLRITLSNITLWLNIENKSRA